MKPVTEIVLLAEDETCGMRDDNPDSLTVELEPLGVLNELEGLDDDMLLDVVLNRVEVVEMGGTPVMKLGVVIIEDVFAYEGIKLVVTVVVDTGPRAVAVEEAKKLELLLGMSGIVSTVLELKEDEIVLDATLSSGEDVEIEEVLIDVRGKVGDGVVDNMTDPGEVVITPEVVNDLIDPEDILEPIAPPELFKVLEDDSRVKLGIINKLETVVMGGGPDEEPDLSTTVDETIVTVVVSPDEVCVVVMVNSEVASGGVGTREPLDGFGNDSVNSPLADICAVFDVKVREPGGNEESCAEEAWLTVVMTVKMAVVGRPFEAVLVTVVRTSDTNAAVELRELLKVGGRTTDTIGLVVITVV